jgi:hypothetical protein
MTASQITKSKKRRGREEGAKTWDPTEKEEENNSDT